MLHWYRLAEETLRARSLARQAGCGIVAHQRGLAETDEASEPFWKIVLTKCAKTDFDFSPTASLSPELREKLFRLGLIEATPLFAGAIFSVFADSELQAIVAAPVALVLTALVCWHLRDQVPPTRIDLSASEPDQSLQPTASRRTTQF